MYARYIPPPKASKPKPDAEQEAFSPAFQSVIPPPSPVVSSATPYARYVPPPRKQPSFSAAPAPVAAAPRPAPVSKTHLNAAAIPDPESLPAKIVFNYDEDEPSPSKRRKLSPEPVPEPQPEPEEEKSTKESNNVKEKKEKKDTKEKKEKKEKKRKPQEQQDGEESADEKPAKKEKKKKRDEQPFAFGFDDSAVGTEEAVNLEGANLRTKDEKKKQHKVDDQVQAELKTDRPDVVETAGEGKKRSKVKSRKEEDVVTARHKAVLERASKYLKSSKDTEGEDTRHGSEEPQEDEEEQEPVEVHGLEPLPQPEPVALDTSRPTYETLPGWIANPIRVTPETKASFAELGVSSEAATNLQSKGYQNAFAVQTAVIPRLLPSADRQGDVVVSAATGSGKTLAYVLPIVRDISQGTMTRLRGLIVVPTRELVMQAKEVCEACAGAFSGPNQKTVKIGISMGNRQFEQEQGDLVEEEQRYDPEGYQQYLQSKFEDDPWEHCFDESPEPLPGHVIDYTSKVDILICTPGRLVDHISRTPGFTLDYVRWLVVDEADKLLAQTFQDWVPVVMPLLSTMNKPGARDFPDSNKSGVRKIVLSATMTRDLTLLNGLKLHRPQLITLEGVGDADGEQTNKTEHVLPELLEETAIKIRDPNLKPLYLVDLLQSEHMAPVNAVSTVDDVDMKDAAVDAAISAESESGSGSSSDSDTSSDESSDDSEESDAESSPSRRRTSSSSEPFSSTVLIFTKSNETAVRLSRLLSLLSPKMASIIGTLTSTTRTSQRRKTLKAFSQQKLRILVASDLVARGIDLSNLDHVVNYDLPTSVASYVHRVGRTARAGRKGHAWTLFTKTEAGWFWTAIAGRGETKSKNRSGGLDGVIRRTGNVAEIRIDDRWEEGRLEEFESALETLGREASEMRRRK